MFGGPSGKLPSGKQNMSFATVPRAPVQRSAFDRSFGHKLTCQAGAVLPMFLDEVIPGDTFSLNSTIFARLSTPVVPFMDNLELTTQYFFVPNRLVWSNWEKFCGAQDNPGDSISFTIPQMGPHSNFTVMSLFDFFGLPPTNNAGTPLEYGGTAGYCSALPARCYNLIWNQWYRDENIQNSATINTGNGPDAFTDYQLLGRGKKKDYFYGSLTAAQKGTAVPFLSGTANVYGPAHTVNTGAGAFQLWNTTDSAVNFGTIDPIVGGAAVRLGATGWATFGGGDAGTGLNLGTAAQYTSLGATTAPPYADLSTNLTDVVNTLRLAFQTQKFLERDARGGTRYIELILSHFGVTNPDFRLQRPEYLGGGVSDITTNPVPQTTPTGIAGTTTKFGDLGAFGTALSNRNGFTKSFTEHGHVLGLMNIRIKQPSYQQGIDRLWSRQTRYDFYWPVFAHLGEQTVLSREIFYAGDAAGSNTDAQVWGYQERYAEYRYKNSSVAGLFRSQAPSTLDTYHFAQNYGATRPALNSTYIIDDSGVILNRNMAVTSSATVSQFKVDIFHKFHTARRMPVNSVPGNMDRF